MDTAGGCWSAIGRLAQPGLACDLGVEFPHRSGYRLEAVGDARQVHPMLGAVVAGRVLCHEAQAGRGL